MLRFKYIFFLFLLVSCGLINSKNKQDEFEPVFKAQINEKPFDGIEKLSEQSSSPRAIMILHKEGQINEYLSLTVSGTKFYQDTFLHNENIVFIMTYEEEIIRYPIQWDTVKTSETSYTFSEVQAIYSEKAGDVLTTGYNNLGDQEGYITVNLDTLETGEVVVSGTFETRVTTTFGASQPYSPWHGVDTLHITNGEYRVLVEDRRNE